MRGFSRFAAAILLGVTTLGGVRALAEAPTDELPTTAPVFAETGPWRPKIQSGADAEAVEDPVALERAARWHLDAGNTELARTLFTRALEREELALYFGKQPELREARVREGMGDFPGAEEKYRALTEKDPLAVALALRIESVHPERDRLFAETVARVRELAARAKAGDKAVPIYVTSKGEPRFLEVIPDEDVLGRLAAFAAGDDSAKPKYCYIENLDLSGVDPASLPPRLDFERCILGRVLIPDSSVGTLVIKGFVLGDFDVGKTWEGEVNRSKARPGSRFGDLTTRETVFLGRANFQDVTISGRKAAFPLTVFEGAADFRGARIGAAADFRFSVFGEGANFKRARMSRAVYFGNARFRKETRFTELFSEEAAYFDSARFEAPVAFDACEFDHGVTLENAAFAAASFTGSQVVGRVNMSRATFAGPLTMKEVVLGGLDLLGADLRADTEIVDAHVDGKVRFSLDDVTRARSVADPSPLLPLYRDYQGDEDAEAPLALHTSYGVESVGDLVARIAENIAFDNTVFGGFVIFDRVIFGEAGKATAASFYNTQFGGETHFERTTWNGTADFSTIYAEELALNEAEFRRGLVLDDANVPGRVTLTDARFGDEATLSFYGAQIANFQVSRDQIEADDGGHRLADERCALGLSPRAGRDGQALSATTCYDRTVDEFVALKQSFGQRAMTGDEDWAWWWIKHHETYGALAAGGVGGWLLFPVRILVFELGFGWGVRLANLGVTAFVVCLAFAWVYKRYCPNTVMSYDGEEVAIRDIPWPGMLYISIQSLGSFNTGWDFGASDNRFRYLNTLHTFSGVIIVTFFVAAYTRMILA